MITDAGKNILAKYLIGQAPAYASHIAVGCGAEPLASDGDLGDYSAKTTLDFEMFRTPIISRGYINEGGFPKVVFTAELPTTERYEITELGVYSSGSNPSASASDSRPILVFSSSERWEYHGESTAVPIPNVTTYLGGEGDVINITQSSPVFSTNADNATLQTESRILKYESCRFLNNIIMMAGNDANITTETISGVSRLKVNTGSHHIHLANAGIDLSKNSPSDELRLAFSIANKYGADNTYPRKVRLLLEFSSTDEYGSGNWARFEVDIAHGTGGYDLINNRYVVITKRLEELYKSTSGFAWSDVKMVKIYACVLDNTDTPTGDFYVSLDALRLENLSSPNPLYGLTGYTVVRNVQAKPIVKYANTTSLVEFRFALDVGTNSAWIS